MNVALRFEAPGDAAAVREINERAFGGTFEARLVEALRGTDGSISLVAIAADRVQPVGHILFTPVTVEPPREPGVRIAGLAPVAVLPGYQRAGIGSRLVREGLAECSRRGYAAVILVGHAEYYPRFGFAPAHAWNLTCEFDVPPDAFMAVELVPGALTRQPGLVRYRPEFSTL